MDNVAVIFFTQQLSKFLIRMFIFVLTPFDTWDCYYFGLNLSLGKAFNIVFYFSKNEEITLPHKFIFVFIRYFNGMILSKKFAKSSRFRKKIKTGVVIYRKGGCGSGGGGGGGGGCVQTFCSTHYDIFRIHQHVTYRWGAISRNQVTKPCSIKTRLPHFCFY